MSRTVDVLVVSYNTKELTLRFLRSLEQHSPPAVSVTVSVLDNASADGSADAIAREFPTVRLVRSASNLGFAIGNNRLAASSVADYLLLVNSDVVVEADIITPMLSALEADRYNVIVGPRLVYPDGEVQASCVPFPGLGAEFAVALRQTRLSAALRPLLDLDARVDRYRSQARLAEGDAVLADFLWATCWLVRRVDFAEFEGFDESFITYDEDLDFCKRVDRAGRRVVYLPSVSLIHLGGRSSSTAEKQAMMLSRRARYYRKHKGAIYAGLYRLGPAAITRFRHRRSGRPGPCSND